MDLPSVLPSISGCPPYGWKNRGIFAVGAMGNRALQACHHLGQLLAPLPKGSEHHGGRGPLIPGCRGPTAVEGQHRHYPGQRVCLGHERAPGKAPGLAAAPPVDYPGSCQGPWSCSHGPRLAAGDCVLPTLRTEAAQAFTERGIRALGDGGRCGHSPFSCGLAQTLQS